MKLFVFSLKTVVGLTKKGYDSVTVHGLRANITENPGYEVSPF